MAKKSTEKFKYLENEKSFYDEIKSIFHQSLSLKKIIFFWKLSVFKGKVLSFFLLSYWSMSLLQKLGWD